jgi:hypothetical protein
MRRHHAAVDQTPGPGVPDVIDAAAAEEQIQARADLRGWNDAVYSETRKRPISAVPPGVRQSISMWRPSRAIISRKP